MVGPNDFLQDVVGLYRPNGGFRVFVVPSDTFMNGDSEFRETGKAAAAQPVVGGHRGSRPPCSIRREDRCEVETEAGTGIKKFYNLEAI